MTNAELVADPWAFGPWCWLVGEVRLLPEPIACRGMQGLWPITSAAIVDALDALTGTRQLWSGLTVLQPFASAIAAGPKRVENRPWRRRIPPGGLWVGLHAGKALYARADELLEEWVSDPDDVDLVPGDSIWRSAPQLDELPRGCLLGAMRIDDILRYPQPGSLL